MGNKTLKLYVNDPMGRRCEMNMQAAVRLRDELGLDLVVIKKTSEEYLAAADDGGQIDQAALEILELDLAPVEFEQQLLDLLDITDLCLADHGCSFLILINTG